MGLYGLERALPTCGVDTQKSDNFSNSLVNKKSLLKWNMHYFQAIYLAMFLNFLFVAKINQKFLALPIPWNQEACSKSRSTKKLNLSPLSTHSIVYFYRIFMNLCVLNKLWLIDWFGNEKITSTVNLRQRLLWRSYVCFNFVVHDACGDVVRCRREWA